ncbi:conserved Plasmodium protein, unknown function [Plasmodium relictum]|uniref:Uncharacterized protein n=1 Tax=Plasmodium relictum TaxID=85471 RepID=A0A1J1H9F7_PLARL|nr:conserved Plasmodium protein, unknown function [Plasmodium relictum]CRH01573.1 conserved Plasmodium protein, unknown function [Plasmodium relictum]
MKYDQSIKNNKNVLNLQIEEKGKDEFEKEVKNEQKSELKNKEGDNSLVHSNYDNSQLKQNLGNMLGLYYSSEEESEVNIEEKDQIINENYSNSIDETSYKNITEEKIRENKNEMKLLKKIKDENKKISEIINEKKLDDKDEIASKTINEKKTNNERVNKGEIKNEIKVNDKKEDIKNCNSLEKGAIEDDNIKKYITENKSLIKSESKVDEKYQKKCGKFIDDINVGIINEENNILHNQKNLLSGEYNNLPSYNSNNMYVNYPYNTYENNNYQYRNFNYMPFSYNINNSSMLYTNNLNTTNESENFYNNMVFSKKKKLNVDLANIPVISQSKILSEWKPNIIQEEKKSKKYNIKTKVYNPVNNTFDKVIIHGKNQKRKHQINWLAKEAIEKEYEILQKTNYNKRRTTNDKYGW